MGRPGGGGSRRSSGGRSSGRSSGGHRSSRSSRPRSSSSYSRNYSRSISTSCRRSYRSSGSDVGDFLFSSIRRSIRRLSLYAIIVLCFIAYMESGPKVKPTTVERFKLETTEPFNSECVVDDKGWVNYPTYTGKMLRDFYDTTGIQPYVYIKEFDKKLDSDSDKEEYANYVYDRVFKEREDGFVLVYFCEKSDNDIGYTAYVCGAQAKSVMDNEAMDTFWNYWDRYWFSDKEMDEVIYYAFNDTGEHIMKKPISLGTIVVVANVALAVIITSGIIFATVHNKNKRKKEEAEETERILNTPMDDLVKSSNEEDLLNKYT